MFRHFYNNKQTLKYETEYGEYFSWGDTIGKNKNGSGSYSFSRDNYNAGVCGSGHNLSEDIPQGNATYDAARANMGSSWKMPNRAQCKKLIDGTNHTWTTINGVNGRKFTSKTDSSKYIFLPAGGRWNNVTMENRSGYGYYWSTTWYSKNSAYYLCNVTNGNSYLEYNHRYIGHSVRAIQQISLKFL